MEVVDSLSLSLDCWPSGKFILLTLGILFISYGQIHVAAPNWSQPHYAPPEQSEIDHIRQTSTPSERIEFSFNLPAFERTTSAAVYEASGKMVRTLWMNRAYDKGEHHAIWDGKDDFGRKILPAKYKITLAYNNVTYIWDGLIGNTESSWSNYRSWDGIVPSFIRSLTFIRGKAYAANGYNESGYAAAVFSESAPNSEVTPLTKLVFSTNEHFMFAATDGQLVYFGFQTYRAKPSPLQGVIAFTPSGEYYRFPGGQPFPSFPQTTGAFWNPAEVPPVGISDVKVVDVSSYPSAAVTGIAVQRSGGLLATAHGFYQPAGQTVVPSADEIRLWNKSTGSPVGVFTLPNPQIMAFDLQNNLWVVSGNGTNDKLYRVTDLGKANRIETPIAGLSNPMSVSVNQKTGSIFVADGGVNQQILEFDAGTYRLLSTIGAKGGYFTGESCNATVTNDKFWLDPGPDLNAAHIVGNNTNFVSWVSADDNGDVWVGDFSTSRILHFTRSNGQWKYVDRVMYLPWAYDSSVPFDRPTRVFGGPTGFLEFKVDYSVPLEAGDPDAPGGNHSWDLARNWLPCLVHEDPTADLNADMSAYSFPNGNVIGAVFSGKTSNIPTLVKLDESGIIQVKHIQPLSGWTAFDEKGGYYQRIGPSNKPPFLISFKQFDVSGYDSNGFPVWYAIGQPLGSYRPDHSVGEPVPRQQRETNWPSSHGIIPVLDSAKNLDISSGTVAFHLGGLPINTTQLRWMTMLEKDIPFTDGDGSFPSVDLIGKAQMGVNAWAMDDNIFAFQNGNASRWSCQFYQFKDNGLFVGQFGFQTSPDYPATNISWKVTGYPQKGTEQPLAPGECQDEPHVNSIRVKGDYYLYLGDEGYHRGIHRWHVSNLQSYGELTGIGAVGSSMDLRTAGTH